VARLGRHRHEATVDAVQQRLAEARARGDERRVALRLRLSRLQRRHLVVREHGHDVTHRLQVVEEPHGGYREACRDGPGLDAPRHVGQIRRPAAHGTGYPEHGGVDGRAGRPAVEERRQERLEAAVVEGRMALDDQRSRAGSARGVQAADRLRSTNVGREQHSHALPVGRGTA